MAQVTNTDIMQTLGRQEEKLDHVIKLAEKTNGRVTSIENWRNGLEAIEQYKKDQPSATNVTTKEGNIVVQAQVNALEGKTKLYIALAGLASVAATALSFFIGSGVAK